MNQQQQNHRLRMRTSIATGLELTLDPAVVKTQNLFSSREGFLTYALYHHRETIKSINTL